MQEALHQIWCFHSQEGKDLPEMCQEDLSTRSDESVKTNIV